MSLSEKMKAPRVRALHNEPAVDSNPLSPDAIYGGDVGVWSREITKLVATEFSFGGTWCVAHLAEELDMARLTVTKRVERLVDLGLLYRTRLGWRATTEGEVLLKKATQGANQ
jgi:hypothetical protein